MRREEDTVARFGAAFFGGREEGLDAVDFAVEKRGGAFVVRGDFDGLQGGAGEDRGAEEFAT